MAGAHEGRREEIAHECGVVSYDDGLVAHALIAQFIRFSL
jgi:hypothetical protein